MTKFIKTLNKKLTITFAISIFSIFAIDLWLIDIPAPHYIIERLGKIYYAICISYLSCFIFHIVVVHIREVNNQELINKYITPIIQQIIVDGKGVIYSMAQYHDYDLESEYPTISDLKYLLGNTNAIEENPDLANPLTLKPLKWDETIYDMLNKHQKNIQRIESKDLFLDTKLLMLLTNIKEAHLVQILGYQIFQNELKSKNLSSLISFVNDYFDKLKELEAYLNKHLSEYKI